VISNQAVDSLKLLFPEYDVLIRCQKIFATIAYIFSKKICKKFSDRHCEIVELKLSSVKVSFWSQSHKL